MFAKKSNNEKTRARYNRLAFLYDLLEAPLERTRFAEWRSRLAKRIQGRHILEVGVGTGKNIPHYPPETRVTAIDISPNMLERAEAKVLALGMDVELKEMDVQNLTFDDNEFDTVFATFVFCSVPDPILGLRELRRVTKAGGKLLLLEHMRPENPTLGFVFDLLNPLVVRMMGANINRRTMENLREAGWAVRVEKRLSGDVVRWIEAEPAKGCSDG